MCYSLPPIGRAEIAAEDDESEFGLPEGWPHADNGRTPPSPTVITVGAGHRTQLHLRALLVTAIHEAGHAVAVELRGGKVSRITLEPGLTEFSLPSGQKLFRNGVMIAEPQLREPNESDAFVAFAGNWAAARARFLSAPRDQRQSFTAYVAAELKCNTSDRQTYEAIELPEGIEEGWHAELLNNWSKIIRRAQRLLEEHRFNLYYSKRPRPGVKTFSGE